MTYRGTGRAVVDSDSPVAFFLCYRCGAWRNRTDVVQQTIYAGAHIISTNLWVCQENERCNDIPNPQRKAIIIPPDPYPVIPASPEFFAYSENPGSTGPTPGSITEFGGPIISTPINTTPILGRSGITEPAGPTSSRPASPYTAAQLIAQLAVDQGGIE